MPCTAGLTICSQAVKRKTAKRAARLAKVCVYATPDDVTLPMILRYELAVRRQVAPPPQRRVVKRCRWRRLQQLQQHTKITILNPLDWISAKRTCKAQQPEHAALVTW